MEFRTRFAERPVASLPNDGSWFALTGTRCKAPPHAGAPCKQPLKKPPPKAGTLLQ
ncbi:hypothetical protein [Kamptonema formosum]|uniref:hypothetical protein n=1 Tax=Kamptonema formosum TaxID=331992 RepID=UPI000346D8C4|nr:hypothetical protein [Oscillatoria sp. PCC 10802]